MGLGSVQVLYLVLYVFVQEACFMGWPTGGGGGEHGVYIFSVSLHCFSNSTSSFFCTEYKVDLQLFSFLVHLFPSSVLPFISLNSTFQAKVGKRALCAKASSAETYGNKCHAFFRKENESIETGNGNRFLILNLFAFSWTLFI